MARGGTRIGGKPKGYKAPKTMQKEAARELVRQRVFQRLGPLLDAQFDNATGIRHFMVRGAGGKFERLVDPEQIEAALNADDAKEGSTYWIYTKDPSVQAFTDLMNRALDKPKEQELDVKMSGTLDVVSTRLQLARKRLAQRKG